MGVVGTFKTLAQLSESTGYRLHQIRHAVDALRGKGQLSPRKVGNTYEYGGDDVRLIVKRLKERARTKGGGQ